MTFLDEANNFHPSIKFTAEISKEQHVFLDTKSRFVGDMISVDHYRKTNKHTPVSFTYKVPPKTAAKMFLTALHFTSNVCVETLRPSQPNGVILSTVSLPNHTSRVYILSPETDNCPS